eukprot:6009825-Pyramimonas_sp.AAC.1
MSAADSRYGLSTAVRALEEEVGELRGEVIELQRLKQIEVEKLAEENENLKHGLRQEEVRQLRGERDAAKRALASLRVEHERVLAESGRVQHSSIVIQGTQNVNQATIEEEEVGVLPLGADAEVVKQRLAQSESALVGENQELARIIQENR